jgi:hypothetical protein
MFTQQVVPTAVALYVGRLLSKQLSGRLPGLNTLTPKQQSATVAGAVFGAGYFLMYAKKGPKLLKKQKSQVMVGLGINLADAILTMVAPTVATQVGVGDYVQIGDYLTVGGVPPIQDDITLSDYVSVDGYDGEGLETDLGLYQDLGVLEQDLGVEMDLGAAHTDFADRHLGGVHRWQMQAPVGHKRYQAPVPPRSFTKPVRHFGDGFDDMNRLYTGIFAD